MKKAVFCIAVAFLALALLFPQASFAQKMKVGYWTSGFSLGFGAVMEQMKFAEKQGLQIDWVKFAEVNGPTRAIVSACRSRRWSRSARERRRRSPVAWPHVSLTSLNRSMSR